MGSLGKMHTSNVKAAIITALPIWTPGLQKRYNDSCGVDLHNSPIVCGASSSCYTNNGYSACSATTFTLPSSNTTVVFSSTPSMFLSTRVITLSLSHGELTTTSSTSPTISSVPTTTSSVPTATSSVPTTTSSVPTTTSLAPPNTSSAPTVFSTNSQYTEISIPQTISGDATKSSLWSTRSTSPNRFNPTTSPTASQISHESNTIISSSIIGQHSIDLPLPDLPIAITGISTTQSVITGTESTLSTITVVPSTLSTRTRVLLTKPVGTGNPTTRPTPPAPSIGPISPTPTSLYVVPSTLVILFAVIGAALASRREWISSAYKYLTRLSQPQGSLTGSPVIYNAPDDDFSIRNVETPPPPYSPYEPSSADQEILAGSHITGAIPWTAMEVLSEAYPIGDRGRHRST